jgi:CRP/FNR family cyclic AMP-dependent transcriptional regulator
METREKIERLRSLALFRHLSEERLAELTDALGVQLVPAGQLVFEEGSGGETMFLLVEGQVRIEKHVEAGGVKELALLSPGDIFGEMALIEHAPRSARAVAQSDATLFVLGRRDLVEWLRSEPVTAMSFFVELLRVLSHRLRRSSREFVLFHDLSYLALQRFEDEAAFLRTAVERMIPHLDGEWSGAAYLYNEFNDAVGRVGTAGQDGERLPETMPMAGATSRWLDDTAYCVVLPAPAGTPLGFVVARNAVAMSPRDRAEVEVALTAAGRLVASALWNIRHDTEERLRARLQHQQTYWSSS